MYSSSLWRIDTIVFAKLNKPPPLQNLSCRQHLLLVSYYGKTPVFFSVSSTYHVTSPGDHFIHIIPAKDIIEIILRVQKQTVTHLHNSLPMDNGDQTWLHIDHKQNNALTWWVSVAVGEIYYHTEETIKQQATFEQQQQQKTKEYGFLKKIMYLQDKLNKTYWS